MCILAQAALDNGVAMIAAGEDVVIVMGGEGGTNDFNFCFHVLSTTSRQDACG